MRYEPIDVSVEELEHLVEQAGVGALPPEGQRKLKAALDTLGTLAELLAERDTTIGQLRALLLGPRKTENTRKLSWLRILLRKCSFAPCSPQSSQSHKVGKGRAQEWSRHWTPVHRRVTAVGWQPPSDPY